MFHGEDLCVDLCQGGFRCAEMVLRNIGKNRLDIREAQQIFKIIDKYQKQDMFLGIFFPYRGWKQVVFRIVVDHSLCQNLVFRVAL